MKNFVAAMAVVLLAGSTAFGQQAYVVMMPVAQAAPIPVATYYQPAAPVAYYAPTPVASPVVAVPQQYYVASPVVAVPRRYYVASPVVAPAPMASAVVVPPSAYGRPVVVHPKVYVPGQPVRNVLRAVTP